MSEKLKYCPFCGGHDWVFGPEAPRWIVCTTCGATGPIGANEEEAKALWNRRENQELRGLMDNLNRAEGTEEGR